MKKKPTFITIDGDDIPLTYDCIYTGDLPCLGKKNGTWSGKADDHWSLGGDAIFAYWLDDGINLFVYCDAANPVSAAVTVYDISDHLFNTGIGRLCEGNIWEWGSSWGVEVFPPEAEPDDDDDIEYECTIWCVPSGSGHPHWVRDAKDDIVVYQNWAEADAAIDRYFSSRIDDGKDRQHDDKRYISYEVGR